MFRYLLLSMKLQKQISRRVGKTEYAKYVIVVPSEEVKEVNWKEGQELEVRVIDNKLVIKAKVK